MLIIKKLSKASSFNFNPTIKPKRRKTNPLPRTNRQPQLSDRLITFKTVPPCACPKRVSPDHVATRKSSKRPSYFKSNATVSTAKVLRRKKKRLTREQAPLKSFYRVQPLLPKPFKVLQHRRQHQLRLSKRHSRWQWPSINAKAIKK